MHLKMSYESSKILMLNPHPLVTIEMTKSLIKMCCPVLPYNVQEYSSGSNLSLFLI